MKDLERVLAKESSKNRLRFARSLVRRMPCVVRKIARNVNSPTTVLLDAPAPTRRAPVPPQFRLLRSENVQPANYCRKPDAPARNFRIHHRTWPPEHLRFLEKRAGSRSWPGLLIRFQPE